MPTNPPSPAPQSDAEKMKIRALTRWEGEGGALGRSAIRTDALDEYELRILARVGYAALGEWSRLPAESKEAMLATICRPLAQGDGAQARKRIADFLGEHGAR